MFGLGWACANEAHLPALPESVALLLNVPAVHVSITQLNGNVVCEYAWRAPQATGKELQNAYYEELELGADLILRVSISTEDPEGLSAAQREPLGPALRLIQAGLECIYVRQNDRGILGDPFSELSDREWQVCRALEGPHGEKQIAHDLACSRHPVHSYVKGIYRKMHLRSRLQVLERLRRSREAIRCAAVEQFAKIHGTGRHWTNGGSELARTPK